MKYVLIVLGALALGLLIIGGGCAAFIAFLIKATPDIPDYATEAYFQQNYGEAIASVHQRLHHDEPLTYNPPAFALNDAVVAIVWQRESEDVFEGDYEFLYQRYAVEIDGGYAISNGRGAVELRVNGQRNQFLLYALNVAGRDYWLVFKPRPPNPKAP